MEPTAGTLTTCCIYARHVEEIPDSFGSQPFGHKGFIVTYIVIDIMALDIFSYRAHSRQQPKCLAKTNPTPPKPHDELEQTPWNQINIPGSLESDGQRLLGPMKVSGHSIRNPTCKDFALATTAVDDQHNPIYMDTDNDPRFRCFNHDCRGRTFSCAENYRRHIREREGSAKIYCTFCRVSFTRRSNLRKHLSERRCRVLKPCQTHGKASSSRSSMAAVTI